MPAEPDDVLAPSAGGADGSSARLQRLEAVTDLALGRLGLVDLLPELLDRVRELLSADTAAILLVDESGDFLLATAARGLEEEVVQGSRVPIGRGFAGTVARHRRPVVIAEVTPLTVVNPVLLRKGIASMLGVPLLDGDELLGVLHVGTLTSRHFNDADIQLLSQAAERAATTIVAARSRANAVAADVLQRSLAPAGLPQIPGLDLAGRYVPGSALGVGGDWYDVFPLPSGRLGVVMGDVMGHGVEAAATMGRVRSALRAYSLEDDDPCSVLSRLDRMVQVFEPNRLVSVVYATHDPVVGTTRICCAGHPPPLVVRPDGTEVLELRQGPPLGSVEGFGRDSAVIEVPEGGSLVLYTDGLIERPDLDIDSAIQQLRRVVAGDVLASAEQMCADVMAELIGASPSRDDVALLVLRRLELSLVA